MAKQSAFIPLVLVSLLAACCQCPKPDTRPLPPPISLGEQIQRLNDHAQALPRLRASGTFVLRYLDDDGKPQQDSVEGFMLIRQRYGPQAAIDPADAYVRGTVLGDLRFYAAKNQDKWWFVRKGVGDSNNGLTGWMGDVEGPPDFSGSHSGGVMRADLVLQVLAITQILPHENETIAMKVRDAARTNELDILRLRSDGTAWVKREIIVDRHTGNVTQVNLGDPAGRLAVRADLKNYQPIHYKEGDEVPKNFQPPLFPRDILIQYKSKNLSIHFTIDSAMLQSKVPDAVFQTPNFAEEGIRQGK